MAEGRFLPDVNVLLALSDRDHTGYRSSSRWFAGLGAARFLLCAITESGFVRLAASPLLGNRTMMEAMDMLHQFAGSPNCAYLPIDRPLLELIAPISFRLQGYRQVTDALLLGLAIRHKCTLVTLDRHVQALAGARYQSNVLTLG